MVENCANKTIDDPVFGTIQVNDFDLFGAVNARCLHCPGEGKIVGAELRVPMGSSFAIIIEPTSAPVADAEAAVGDVSDRIAGKQAAGDDATDVDETDDFPWMQVLVAVIAIAIVALVGFMFLRSQNKPGA